MAQVAVGEIHLEVEQAGPADAPAILLTRGLGTQLIEWPTAFWRGLVEGGFRVVRYDNRDVGLSQKFGPCDVAPDAASLRGQDSPPAAYVLYDMAADSVGLLDALGIDKAHILGISMGGMISQILAARYPARARSLISVMSSAGEANPVAGPDDAVDALWEPWPPAADREAIIAKGMRDTTLFGSRSHPLDDDSLRRGVIAAAERCYCPGGILRQRAAVMTSGPRTHLLAEIACPTLVLHGDEDPLIPVASAERAAQTIPGASLKVVAGMGHDLPDPLIPEILEAVLTHCRGAG